MSNTKNCLECGTSINLEGGRKKYCDECARKRKNRRSRATYHTPEGKAKVKAYINSPAGQRARKRRNWKKRQKNHPYNPYAPFKPYKEYTIEEKMAYYNSDEWVEKKNKKLRQAGFKCEKCGASGVLLEVHHINYNNFRREELDDLRVVCKKCHHRLHRIYWETDF